MSPVWVSKKSFASLESAENDDFLKSPIPLKNVD